MPAVVEEGAALEPGPPAPTRRRRWSRWHSAVGAITALGLAVRLAPVLAHPHLRAQGDAYFYHSEANLLVAGLGWINPFTYYPSNLHEHVPVASFPPLFTLVLAAASLVGAKSFLAHRIWCCVIGASACALGAATGRTIAGRRVGLIAALLIAVYPNLWISDGLGLSETLSPVVALAVLLAAYRFWQRPSLRQVVLLGTLIGAAALARDEMAALAVLILLPMVLVVPGPSRRRRLGLLAAGGLAAATVVAPWVGYNLTRFDKPVFISDGLGVT
ncbi:MAG: glycosyltransferase family 39 protein, partial [Acidimicrobiales bacterium]